jgi:alpha-tubulin suppressor-like RCC1 family protein
VRDRQLQRLQLGNGGTQTTFYAGNGPTLPLTPITVSAGHYHTCAVLADRTLRCWGRNNYGEHGIPDTAYYKPTPVTPNW